jgi:hypothetical protein
MVLGKPEELWNSSRHQGHLYMPTLGVMVPMTVGDMVFFNASELPHLVIKLDEADNHHHRHHLHLCPDGRRSRASPRLLPPLDATLKCSPGPELGLRGTGQLIIHCRNWQTAFVVQRGGQVWGLHWMSQLRGENRRSLWGDSMDSPVGQVNINSAGTILYSYTLSFFMSTPKRSGWCRRCNQHLRDLLDHIKKQHPNDKFTHRDIKDSTLIVCPCGRVVLDHAGLIKHRHRYRCVKATPRPSIRD